MGSPGGATLVVAWIAEALMNSHRVTLRATGREIDFDELNRVYGTHLDPGRIEVRQWPPVPPWPRRFVRRTRILQLAALVRSLNSRPDDYDVYVSGTNEVMLPAPHLQYIQFAQHHLPAMRLQYAGVRRHLRIANELAWRAIGGQWKIDLTKSHVLANSAWSGDQLAALYGIHPEVVYPPVPLPGDPGVPWSKRDFAFVTVGRFDPEKRLHDAISIVDRLRHRFPGLKLHIVGFGQGSYRNLISRLAVRRSSFVTLHENVSREFLTRLMSDCQFGLHCSPGEHFGLAPAELTACGCLTFVHNSGGQVEIVDHDPELVFDDVEDSCQKIVRQIERSELAEEKALYYRKMARARFGCERFTRQVRDCIGRLLRSEAASPVPCTAEPGQVEPLACTAAENAGLLPLG